MTVDLLLDLSGAAPGAPIGSVLETLGDSDGLAAITGRAWCILPPETDIDAPKLVTAWSFTPAERALATSNCALEAAARAHRPLVVMLGPVLAGSEPVSTLLEGLAADPMFGFAIARVADGNGSLAKLDSTLGDCELQTLPRAVLGVLPEHYIVPESVGRCFALRPEVVANFGPLDSRFRTMAGAWLHYLCRARRVGFRGIIVNRAVAALAGGPLVTTAAPHPEDYWTLHRQYPDTEYARQEFRRQPAHEYETFAGRAFSMDDALRKTLLIDARGMPAAYNGTACSILGLLNGFATVAPHWRISLVANPDAKVFHQLQERFPGWTVLDHLPQRYFAVSLRLNQPWDSRTLAELHTRALFNFYYLHDTISWDVLYNGSVPESVETAWRFMAEYADGIFYNSDFSRQRFAVRFPSSPQVKHTVCYLSTHPDDYPPAADPGASTADGYLLVIGNHLDHKWVPETVELLATAFPFHQIRALGCRNLGLPNATGVMSGGLSENEIARLYAGARIVVFPSFYEGFGFPIVAALNYGKTVVARHSALLEEVAALCRAEGRLYAFTDPAELLELVANLLRGAAPAGMPLGGALKEGEQPMRWADSARNILDSLDEALQTPSPSQWWRRMRAGGAIQR